MDNVRSRHQLYPASHPMSDSLHSWSQPSARTCYNTAWSHNSKLFALSGGLPQCPAHPCCCAMSTPPPRSPQACFPFPRFSLRTPSAPTLHLIVFSYPAQSSLTPKLLVSISKPWPCSCLPLSQAPYLDLLSVFTPLDPRVLPGSHVWMCA